MQTISTTAAARPAACCALCARPFGPGDASPEEGRGGSQRDPFAPAPRPAPPPGPGPAQQAYVFLFVDVDGYCTGGIDQRLIITPRADGYRARELGWAYYTAHEHATGSVYFYDGAGPGLAADAGVARVRRLHGLPVSPAAGAYGEEPALCSTRLLEAFRIVHDAAAWATGRPVVVVHKGGNEGLWARQAVAGVRTLDLGDHGCPKVDALGRAHPAAHVGRECPFHAPARRRAGKVVHCPRLEVDLLARWVAGQLG
jgi:hypothetical protein